MRLSLAEQIAQLEEAAPVELDSEDLQNSDADERSTDLAAREHYLDVGRSTLRKLHDKISDPKYDGVKTTRKLLQEDSEDDMVRSEDEEAEDFSGYVHEDQSAKEGGADEVSSESDEVNEGLPPTSPNMPQKSLQGHGSRDGLTSTLQKTRDEDRKKGRAISRQITTWDTLLDARIRMQKSVVATNKFPVPSDLRKSLQSPDYTGVVLRMMEEATALSNEIFELQEDLLTSNEPITVPPRKRRKIQSDNTTDDYAVCLEEATQMVSTLEHLLHPHLVQTLSKWSSKIQAVAPSLLLPSHKSTFLTKNSQQLKSVVQLIDETLADHDKLLARTRIRKNARIGDPADANGEVDEDNFDDTDFYQQLLRDVIDARGHGADDWMVVQRQKKAKKTVDTKASKGRKVRYEVHEKLQNFMVPVPVTGVWHEEQIDELFSSLFGKGFEHLMGGDEDEDKQRLELEEQLDEALKNGYRVFG